VAADVPQSAPDMMQTDGYKNISKLEDTLWEAADSLRANSKLTSSDYFMPVLGVIFLRHAANRFDAAHRQIEADQASGKMPKRTIRPADYVSRRSLFLPELARFDWLMDRATADPAGLPALVTAAMQAVEDDFEPLKGVLPKDYGIFEPAVLEHLMRLFNSEQIKQATGDVFGRIYEYFLAKFSMQKAHDNGEFFTPSSLVQMLVNVIEPGHGTPSDPTLGQVVFDPACGSGGMFVQSSHFIEEDGEDTARKVTFYGQEKNGDTIRIAKMNLAVHGLEGTIADAITYYEDRYTLTGKCDFVMANPPFNVDLVDGERILGDIRLPFGLPGVNKQKKVSNGNYLWISYFWSYLSPIGRAGFVMSSQASSAGKSEMGVRRKIVETGDVDVMVAIRSNFFYTRAVPCELWHFDRSKPAERRGHVLMLDARSVFRKVTRTICDFSPEQLRNLTAIVWLYRGQQDRFLALVADYVSRICTEGAKVADALTTFDGLLADVHTRVGVLATAVVTLEALDAANKQPLLEGAAELTGARALYEADAVSVRSGLTAFAAACSAGAPATNTEQHAARQAFDPHAEAIRGLIKQVDLLYKLAARTADAAAAIAGHEAVDTDHDRRAVARLVRQLDEARRVAVEQLRHTVYFHRQVVWLQDRFPKAELEHVPGLVKLVTVKDIEAADWSLTPGRYVGVAPPDVDDDFDFEQTLRDIHVELADLNREATTLASQIQDALEALAV